MQLNNSASSFGLLPDGALAVNSGNNLINIVNTASSVIANKLTGHNDQCYSLVALPNDRLACGGYTYIYIFQVNNQTLLKRISTVTTSHIYSLTVLPNGNLVCGTNNYLDTTIRIWNTNSGLNVQNLTDSGTTINRLWTSVVLLNGNLATSSAYENYIRIWNTNNGSVILRISAHSFINLAVLPDGSLAASQYWSSLGNNINIYSTITGALIRTLLGHTNTVKAIVVLPDMSLASGSGDGTIKIWNTNTGNLIRSFNPSGTVNCLTVLLNGALASGSNSIQIWA